MGMLIDFSFGNYRSFRDEQSFTMSRTSKKGESSKTDAVSRVAAIYGANASGKSNFLMALWHMTSLVANSYAQGDGSSHILRDSFALRRTGAGDGAEASMYFAEFMGDDGCRYQYWFTFDDQRILTEDLLVYKKKGDRLSAHASRLFSRDADGVDFGPSFKGPRAQVRQTMRLRPNALALSAAAAAGIESIRPAFDFFTKDIAYCSAVAFRQEQPIIINEVMRNTQFAQNLAQMLRFADFGIDGMQAVPVAPDSQGIELLKRQFREQLGADEAKMEQVFGNQPPQMELRLEHVGDGVKAMFDSKHESNGTLSALSFFSLALRQLSRGTVTLIDEIDTSLHPLLVKEFVALYADPVTNPHHAQLLFTTHDASLIDASGSANRLLDADQIWLTEKTKDGASEIYPVTDMHIRKGENIGRNYLNGVYGATPRPAFHTLVAQIMSAQSEEPGRNEVVATGGDGDES